MWEQVLSWDSSALLALQGSEPYTLSSDFLMPNYHHTGKRRNALDCSDRCPTDFPKNSKNRHHHGRSAAPHSSCHKPDSKTLDCSPQTLCNLPLGFL